MINETNIEYPILKEYVWNCRIAIGKWLNSFIGPIVEECRLQKIANSEQSRAIGGQLSSKQLEEISFYLSQVKDLEIRRNYFNSKSMEETLSGLIVPLIVDVLERTPTISSVLNIGAFYAFIDHALAIQFPKVTFTAADILPNMTEYNAEFVRENLNFLSCYPLEQLKTGKLNPDITMFSATAAEIMNHELNAYFGLLSKCSTYIVLSEPIYPLPDGTVIDPEIVEINKSIPAYAQPNYLPHPMGPVAYVHNYKKMLIKNGFEVLHYRVFKPKITDLGWIHCIAKSKQLSN